MKPGCVWCEQVFTHLGTGKRWQDGNITFYCTFNLRYHFQLKHNYPYGIVSWRGTVNLQVSSPMGRMLAEAVPMVTLLAWWLGDFFQLHYREGVRWAQRGRPFPGTGESATPNTKATRTVKLRQLKKNPFQQSCIWLCKPGASGYVTTSTAVRTVGSY